MADDRSNERLVREQTVPTERLGGSARWIGSLGSAERDHTLVAGLEAGRSEGVSDETIFLPGREIGTSAGYRSFRAPTLNELYRGFRVGDVVTDPNPALEAERLTGAEAGAIWTPAPDPDPDRAVRDLRLRAHLFWMRLEDPIANVTLSTGPELIVRQRRNLGRTPLRTVGSPRLLSLGLRWDRAGR